MNTEKNLFYLNELSDYKVSDSDKDVRGWPVNDNSGNFIGKVDNLLVSKENKRVVYLDIEMDKAIIDANHKPYATPAQNGAHTFLNKEGENHIIIPVGLAQLDISEEIVNTPNISKQIFSETKRIPKGSTIDRHYETSILESYGRDQDVNFTQAERTENNSALYRRKEYTKMYAGAY